MENNILSSDVPPENTMEPVSDIFATEPTARKKRRSKKDPPPPPPPECSVCCEPYNKSLRACITCNYEDCNYSACKTCVRTYLLSTAQEPHCMNCKKPFDIEFMHANLNKSYCMNEFKDHRKKILFDLEVSKIPETIPIVERHVKADEIAEENRELQKEINELHRKIRAVETKQTDNRIKINELLNKNHKKEKREFIMPCTNEDCRGFLSTAYKCEICKNFTCPHCLEMIGVDKEMAHTCNEDSVKSAVEIKKNTRPCPSCGTRIFKIEGCDQIWCTECHVAFSWNTGKVDTGVVHNPHYYEWRRSGGKEARQQVGGGANAPNVCNNMPNWFDFNRRIKIYIDNFYNDFKTMNHDCQLSLKYETYVKKYYTNITQFLKYSMTMHRNVEHFTNITIPRMRRDIERCENNEEHRINYILKRITADEFKTYIWQNTCKRKKLIDSFFIYEIISQVGRDFFYQLMSTEVNDIIKKISIKNAIMNDHKDYLISKEKECRKNYIDLIFAIVELGRIFEKKYAEIKAFFSYCNRQFQRNSVLNNETVIQFILDDDYQTFSYINRKFTKAEAELMTENDTNEVGDFDYTKEDKLLHKHIESVMNDTESVLKNKRYFDNKR